ncbi:MAG TPA: MerR family transcriptional regulator [Actinospica sp.]|nr:MerR family transcriptional regulator [Actinospica sp.]
MSRLAAEFPGIRAETLRVLEQHGLVSPSRNSAGFRRYGERDLEAVRRALSAPPAPRGEQQPAEAEPAGSAAASAAAPAALWRAPAVAPRVTAGAAGAAVWQTSADAARAGAPSAPAGAAASSGGRAAAPAPEEALSASSQGAAKRRSARWPEPDYFTPELGEVALGREGLARAAGLAGEWVDELAAHGLISGCEPASGADLLVARAAAELLGHGIEPRHLRPVQAAADRAAVLIKAAGGGSSRSNPAQAAAALVRLEAALLRAALLDD